MPELRRILVVALDNLGDLVFASALVPPIRQAFPSAVIGVWCKEYTAPIARLIPHVDQVFSFDDAGKAHRRLEERKNIGKVVLVP